MENNWGVHILQAVARKKKHIKVCFDTLSDGSYENLAF